MLQVYIILVASLSLTAIRATGEDDPKELDLIWKNTAEIIRMRGYIAEEHYVTISDGYILSVVRGLNPLINNGTKGLPGKVPLLFIHGILTSSTYFVINTVNARPKDYSKYNVTSMSKENLQELLLDDPSAKSLAFTALNFGHEVWLLNRRGAPFSQGHVGADLEPYSNPIQNVIDTLFGQLIRSYPETSNSSSSSGDLIGELVSNFYKNYNNNISELIGKESSTNKLLDRALRVLVENFNLTEAYDSIRNSAIDKITPVPLPPFFPGLFENTFNPRFWNFSFDEQARYDVPEVIDYILSKTNRDKLSIVGHSIGSAIAMMAMVERPEIQKKLSKAVLWAPAVDLAKAPIDSIGALILSQTLSPIAISSLGPFPPYSLVLLLQYVLGNICTSDIAMKAFCTPLIDLFAGPSFLQEQLKPSALAHFFFPVNSKEGKQLFNSVYTGKMHYFDYFDPIKNYQVYGQISPPAYDFGQITFKGLSLYNGNTDTLVTQTGTAVLIKDLKVPIEHHLVGGNGLFFNHLSWMLQDKNVEYVTIPSLMSLYSPNPA